MSATLPARAIARRVLFMAGAACVAAGLLLIPAGRSTAAAAHGHGLSVTVKGPRLFNGDVSTPKLLKERSSVTVSQARSLVNQFVKVSWKHVTPTDMAGSSGYDPSLVNYAVMVTECRGAHPTKWSQCYGATQGGKQGAQGTDGPFNAVYGITAPNGQGAIDINVETTLENAFLGCDSHHPCSLVIVPGQGGNDVNFPTRNNIFHCNDHSEDAGGAFANGFGTPEFTFQSSTGSCSWKDRITIPLHFSAAVNGCPLRKSQFTAAGSPMMARAMVQWLSGLCAGSNPLDISYDSELSEPTAMLEASTGLVDVALTTRPGSADKADGVNLPASRHYVYAPIGISAVSVAYWIDNAVTGSPFQRLLLNQRLLAKLLTTSYNFGGAGCVPHQKPPPLGCDSGVYYKNPLLTFDDREFEKLNPWMTAKRTANDVGNTFEIPTVQSGHSDMTWNVTRWIASSPTAASFLRGRPDPWGMRVDKYYKNISWPNDAFLSQDPFIVYANQYSPVFSLSKVAFYQSMNWTPGVAAEKLNGNYPANQPELPGARALFSVLDEADSSALQFPSAALRNAAGRYVEPTSAGMAAAVAHMTGNGGGTLQVNLASKDPHAYPLTMVIYAAVPTAGTSHAKAAAIARFLDFAADAGQTRGVQPGQLPEGYLPLTASLRAQTRAIAVRVANQSGTTPAPSPSSSSSAPSTPSPGAGGSPSGGASPSPSVSLPSVSPSVQGITAVPQANPQEAGAGRLILPLLLIFGGLTAIGGGAALAGSASLSIADRLRILGKSLGSRSTLGRRN
jgi:hypothetical protein